MTNTSAALEQMAPEVTEQELSTPELNEELHTQVAETYNSWFKDVSKEGKNPRLEIARPKNFQDDWKRHSSQEYFLHRLSILGVDKSPPITATDVQLLFASSSTELNRLGRLEVIQAAFNAMNADLRLMGIPNVNLDFASSVFFLPSTRIHELIETSVGDLAFTLLDEPHEMILPSDDPELNADPNQLFDVVAHELGHQCRERQKLGNTHNVVEEAIVQAQAKKLAHKLDRVSSRTDSIYAFEVIIIEKLAIKLGVPSLFHMSMSQIQEGMQRIYRSEGKRGDVLYASFATELQTYRALWDKLSMDR